jgi:RHS repeat-associated protein
VTQTDPNNPLSLTKQQDKVTVNGKLFTTTFDKTVSPPTVTRSTAAGRSTVTQLDAKGRPTQITVQSTLGLQPVHFAYYGSGPHAGKLQSIVQGAGSTERRYALSYDSSGNLASIAAPLGKTVSYGYDSVGRVTAKVLPDGSRVRFAYDANGNVSTVMQPGSSLLPTPSDVHQLDHGPLDFLSSYTPPDIGLSSGATSFQYTADREPGLVTRPDGLTIAPVYDSAGRLAELDVPGGFIAYTYFPSTDATRAGKAQSVTSGIDGVTVSYGWSGSLPVSTSWSGAVTGSVTRAYDNDLRLTTEAVGADTVSYVYGDADGLLTQAGALGLSLDAKTALLLGTTLARVADSIGYNGFAEPASYEAHWLDPSNNPVSLYSTSHVRDAFGRITRKTEAVSAGAALVHEYGYDDAGRLTDVLEGPQPCDQGLCANIGHYAYDANGNRTAYDPGTGPIDASYDAQDRLLTYGPNAYSYTLNGELSEKNAGGVITTYSYDVLGNLRTVHLPDSRTIDYVIDGLGRRIGKKIDGALQRGWLYRNGLSLVAELGPDGQTVVARFVYGTRGHVPDYMVKGGSTYRIITDHLGSVRLVVDATTGVVAQEMSYDEFGRVLQDTNPGFQPFGFAGGLWDGDTGLVRFGARDYDAETGRWTAKDPILFGGHQANLYVYVGNDPVNRSDPWGRVDACEVLCEGAVFGVCMAIVHGLPLHFACHLIASQPCFAICPDVPEEPESNFCEWPGSPRDWATPDEVTCPAFFGPRQT